MKLDKGQSKNRHVIRPRNVDQNKKLLVSIDQEDSTTELQIPRVQNIEVPKIDVISSYKSQTKLFKTPEYYYKHLTLPTNSLENILSYEMTEDDKQVLHLLLLNKKVPSGLVTEELLEKIIEAWEIDTGRGQIIPHVRAAYLVKELKLCEKLDLPENLAASGLIIQSFYDHWLKTRDKMGRPLMRRFWKSEGITDNQLKIAFQPRGAGYRERMRLRNSKKNDQENFDKVNLMKMKGLLRQMESLQVIIKAAFYREQVKKQVLEHKVVAFEVERCEKLQKKCEVSWPDMKILEACKELRSSTKISELPMQVTPALNVPQMVQTQLILKPELPLPLKRVRSEVQKKTDVSFEIALICCRLINEGERMRLWPLIDPKRGESQENNHVDNHTMQLQNEEQMKMRGRIVRGTKKIAIDRLMINDCEHSWGRYMGITGNWYSLDRESHSEFYDEEDNEAFQRVHKLLTSGIRRKYN